MKRSQTCMKLLGAAAAACLLAGCAAHGGFAGAWQVHIEEADHAYWVEPAGAADRTLAIEERMGKVAASFADEPAIRLEGQAEADRATLSGSTNGVTLTLDLTLGETGLSGTLRRSLRQDYGGWWQWKVSGHRLAEGEAGPAAP